MNGTDSGVPTRYSTGQAKKEQRNRYVLLALIGLAGLLIVVFVVLLMLNAGV